jgi:hypothetical protein
MSSVIRSKDPEDLFEMLKKGVGIIIKIISIDENAEKLKSSHTAGRNE